LSSPEIGSIGWHDLTVLNADAVRDFYSKVVGWRYQEVDMGGYADFTMVVPETGNPAGGICHARGVNQGIPPYWLMYIIVENVDRSTRLCTELGGAVVVQPKDMGGHGRYSVIKDPAGAFVGLFQPPSSST
jgi:hypothetical protein